MQVIDKSSMITEYGSVVTIGKFDGLHIGHRAIIDKVSKEAGDKLKKIVVSFVNHPDYILSDNFTGTILTEEEKIRELDELSIDYYCALTFDEKLKNTECDVFFDEFIINKWKCSCLVVGDDFKFGKNRKGDINYLINACEKKGIKLIVVDRLEYKNAPVSSSRIRDCIVNGELLDAVNMLGSNYSFSGKVVKGNQLGRTIDFPTVNLEPNRLKVLPKIGVYKSRTYVDGVWYNSITNIGYKPTINKQSDLVIETNILDFSKDIYDKTISVSLVEYLRGEVKFSSLDELKKQLLIDKKCWTN